MFELPKLLITGAQGQLGYELAARAQEDGFVVLSPSSAELDICDLQAVNTLLEREKPRYLVNAAGQVPVFNSDRLPDFGVNSKGAATLSAACRAQDVVLIQISCADVFDGSSAESWREDAQPAPVSDYGRSLLEAELQVRATLERHIVLRTGWLFSARGRSAVRQLLEQARSSEQVCVADGLTGSPTSAVDLARVVIAVIKQLDCGVANWGIYHYCAAEPVSWFGFSEAVIAAARQYEDLPLEQLIAVHQSELGRHQRAPSTELNCQKILRDFGIHQRSWRTGLMQVVRNLYSWSE